jgi:hypothetical protein
MAGNSQALSTYNTGRTIGMVGVVLSGVGGGLIGWDLGQQAAGGEGSATIGAGAAFVGIGLVVAVIGDSKVKKSVTLYNSRLMGSNSVPAQLKFGFTQNGVGLNMRF